MLGTFVFFLLLVIPWLAVASNQSQSSIVGYIAGGISGVFILGICLLLAYTGITLCYRACRHYRSQNGAVSAMDRYHKRLMYEMMPLVLYPVMLGIAAVPGAIIGKSTVLALSLFCLSTALFLVLHVLCVLGVAMRKRMTSKNKATTAKDNGGTELQQTANVTTHVISVTENTYYSGPIEE